MGCDDWSAPSKDPKTSPRLFEDAVSDRNQTHGISTAPSYQVAGKNRPRLPGASTPKFDIMGMTIRPLAKRLELSADEVEGFRGRWNNEVAQRRVQCMFVSHM